MVAEALVVAYYSLNLVIIGTIFNLLTFIILCRSTFTNTRAKSTFHYMRTIAIFDILMLYGWNFDHYLSGVYGYTLQRSSIGLCRLLSFYNYFTSQSSAWLRIFICFDRYLSLSRLHNTCFQRSKTVLIIITSIILFFTLFNSIFFFYGCSYKPDGNIRAQSWAFLIYPLWDYINLAVYNFLPFILMLLFNSGVIYHLIRLRYEAIIQHSRVQHAAISITLVITTFLFLIMTVPGTVGFAFFSTGNPTVLRLLDGILYTYHITSFPLYLIIYGKFRREFFLFIRCKSNNRRVIPMNR